MEAEWAEVQSHCSDCRLDCLITLGSCNQGPSTAEPQTEPVHLFQKLFPFEALTLFRKKGPLVKTSKHRSVLLHGRVSWLNFSVAKMIFCKGGARKIEAIIKFHKAAKGTSSQVPLWLGILELPS